MKQRRVDALGQENTDDMVPVRGTEIATVSRYFLPEGAIGVEELRCATGQRCKRNCAGVQSVLARDLEFVFGADRHIWRKTR